MFFLFTALYLCYLYFCNPFHQDLETNPQLRATGFSVLSLNIHRLPVDLQNYPWYRLETWRSKYLHEFDVVCLQELFQEIHLQSFFAQTTVDFPWAARGAYWSGLVILSRYPLTNTGFVSFKRATGADKLAAKGILYTLAHTPRGKIWILNTHLQSGRSRTQYYMRKHDQLPLLWQTIDVLTTLGDYRMLVMGDFNFDAQANEYREVARVFNAIQISDISQNLLSAGVLTFRENRVSKFQTQANLKLDYIWASQEFLEEDLVVRSRPFPLAPNWYASDHFGIQAIFA